jgi:hypothetical protein
MVRGWAAAAIAAFAVQDDPLVKEAVKGWRHPWADFREGSTVTQRESLRVPEIDDQGNLVQKETASDVSWTVTSVEGHKVNLKIVRGEQENEVPHFLGPPNGFRGKGEKRGTEEVVVAGRKLVCEVTSIALDAGKDAAQVTTIARSPEVPYWAVRFRVETLMRGKVNTSEEELLVGVNEKVKVGDRELVCQVVEVTTRAGAGRSVRREWRSDEVPGRLVRRETRQFQGDKEITLAGSKMEVVSYRARK